MSDTDRCRDCAFYHPYVDYPDWWQRLWGAPKKIVYGNGKCHAEWRVVTHGQGYLAAAMLGQKLYSDTHGDDPCTNEKFVADEVPAEKKG